MGSRVWLVGCCFAAVGWAATVCADDPMRNGARFAQATVSPDEKPSAKPKAPSELLPGGSSADGKKMAAPSVPGALKEPEVAQTSVEGLSEIVSKTGIKYWDIKVGEGESPDASATVIVRLSSWLEDGTLWYTSARANRPDRLLVERLPPGLAEGLLSMKIGGKRRIEIPSKLGFGSTNTPKGVPPDADLVYEVELIAVKRQVPPPVQTSVTGIEPTTTPSGLKFWDIKAGTGKLPKADSIVTVHYAGWLSTGRLFHSTIQQGRPESFRLDKVIKGLGEGVKSMKVGGKRRLEVPHELAYGEEGMGRHVPPNSRLVFEVELLEVQPRLDPPRQTSVEHLKPVVLPSGVKYWDMRVGDGRSPDLVSDVTVHYTGWLTDGTVFDSSVELGQPLTVRLAAMIKGWQVGLVTMKVGGKRRLEIPYDMGFGEKGEPPRVPPKATLIYEVSLLDVGY